MISKTHLQAIFLLLFLISLGFNGYLLFARKSTERITQPPIYGEFKPATPLSQKPTGEPLVITWKTDTEYIEIETEGEVNDSIIKKFTDSITTLEEQLQIVTSLATYREFEHTFEDENLRINFEGLTQGWLKSIGVSKYEIKEREVEIPSYHRILLGGEIGNNTLLNDFQYKVNAGYQTPKGTIYKAAYSRQGSIDYIWIGGEFTVLKF